MVNITGLAKDKRAVILSLINEEIKSSYFSLERIQEIFTSVSLARIKQLILQVMHRYEYFLDDYSLLNYVLHIALTVELRVPIPHANLTRPVRSWYRTPICSVWLRRMSRASSTICTCC